MEPQAPEAACKFLPVGADAGLCRTPYAQRLPVHCGGWPWLCPGLEGDSLLAQPQLSAGLPQGVEDAGHPGGSSRHSALQSVCSYTTTLEGCWRMHKCLCLLDVVTYTRLGCMLRRVLSATLG